MHLVPRGMLRPGKQRHAHLAVGSRVPAPETVPPSADDLLASLDVIPDDVAVEVAAGGKASAGANQDGDCSPRVPRSCASTYATMRTPVSFAWASTTNSNPQRLFPSTSTVS